MSSKQGYTVKYPIAKSLLHYGVIAASAILLAFNYQLFVVKNGFAPAGLNGIATMVQYKTGFSIGYMSLLINIPLCIFSYFCLNKEFAKRSLCFCLVYSFVFLYLQSLGLEAFQYDAQGHDTIFPCILSGVISGIVYGICFQNNASTGGTDIVSKYISTHKPELNFFYVTFCLNALVAVSSFFVYAQPGPDGALVYDYKPVCLCILYCFLSSFVGSYLISGTKKACKFTVITAHPDEITADIASKLKHGSTRITAMGSYHREERTVLICVVNPHQIVDFKNILKNYDDTFAFHETVEETHGNFKRIK
ncbi:MAG: YitT family protein [Clostridiales bacterium]|nr:YitT family protein [Clostridiales bacterium]